MSSARGNRWLSEGTSDKKAAAPLEQGKEETWVNSLYGESAPDMSPVVGGDNVRVSVSSMVEAWTTFRDLPLTSTNVGPSCTQRARPIETRGLGEIS